MNERHSALRWIALAAALTCAAFAVFSIIDREGRAEERSDSAAPAPTVSNARPTPLRRHPAPASSPATARVTWGVTRASLPVPPSFLGFSTEYWTLPLWERRRALLERALALIHVPGDAPQVLRIGGDSADHTFWDPRRRALPPWAFGVGPSWIRFAASLVRRDRLHLILDLNLVTGSSPKAAR